MATFRGAESLVIIFATVASTLTVGIERARACSCLQPTVESSYNTSSDVVRARIVRKQGSARMTRYVARVQRTFKGCLVAQQQVVLTTPSSSASCGVELQVGRDYLINGDPAGTHQGLTQLAINLCDYNRLFSSLSAHDLEFLDGRTVCCGGSCTCADGSQPVNCFVDPCEVAPECPAGECVANYCGGCNAEFYDENGYAVCEACQTQDDCSVNEYCASGRVCEGDGRCQHDVDCNLPGNDYPHIECVGYGVCDDASGQCGWRCDNPQCLDLAGFNFGPCDAVLGVVVLDGRCVEVSGCDAGGFHVFASAAECQDACGLGKVSECASDADCMVTGCSGQICAPEPVVTTCEWRPEYACYQDPTITTCGCNAERCAWDNTPELQLCLAGGSCGGNICGPGQYCCNESCGICVPLDAACTQRLC